MVKNPPANAGDLGSIPGWGRFPGEGHGNPFQSSCLDNPTDRGAWGATVHRVAKSGTRLSDQCSQCQEVTCIHLLSLPCNPEAGIITIRILGKALKQTQAVSGEEAASRQSGFEALFLNPLCIQDDPAVFSPALMTSGAGDSLLRGALCQRTSCALLGVKQCPLLDNSSSLPTCDTGE